MTNEYSPIDKTVDDILSEYLPVLSGEVSPGPRSPEPAIPAPSAAAPERRPPLEEDGSGAAQAGPGDEPPPRRAQPGRPGETPLYLETLYGAATAGDEDMRVYTPRKLSRSEEAREYMRNVLSYDSAGEQDDIVLYRHFMPTGEEEEQLRFGGQSIDLGPEEDYSPPEQETYIPSEPDGEPEKPGEKRSLFGRFKRKPNIRYTGGDVEEQDSYASKRDYDLEDDGDDGDGYEAARPRRSRETGREGFPSFRQYVASLIASAVFRLHGTGTLSADTVPEDDEDLGPEVSVKAAAKYYGAFTRSLQLRTRISGALLFVMCYLSIDMPVFGMLKSQAVAAGACLALQLCIMLLSLDVVTGAILNASRLHLGADSLAVISCLVTTADALTLLLSDSAVMHTPLCVLSSLSLVGVLYASLASARGLRKSLRVPAIGKRCYSVRAYIDRKSKRFFLIKHLNKPTGFVRRSEEAPQDETVFQKLGPFLLALALLLTLAVTAIRRSYTDILFVFSAILAPAVPFTALLSCALPFCFGSQLIFPSGAAIAGWSGLCDVGRSRDLIVTDTDLFPTSAVEMTGIRIFADEPADRIISYAGTLISALECGISPCFEELMEKHRCSAQSMEGFEVQSGGGAKAIIDGHTVLCGSTDLMRLMNVALPYRLVDKTSVLLAIDGMLYGIFSLSYTPLPQVRDALTRLIQSDKHPVFAIRDFNVNPELLHNLFDLATDGYDFPPYAERFGITADDGGEGGHIAAVLCREDLGCLAKLADTGRAVYDVSRANVIISVIGALTGMALSFVKLLTAGFVAIRFLIAFMLIAALPVLLICIFMVLSR